MKFEDWEPIYGQILKDFGFAESEDIASALALVDILRSSHSNRNIERIVSDKISGKSFIIIGPCFQKRQMEELPRTLQDEDLCLVTVGEGTKNCIDLNIIPEMLFTDLDGYPSAEVSANQKGAIAFIHAHGDNLPLLKEWVPEFRQIVVPTCQCRPFDGIFNWGGFTDGDRAYCTLGHFAAKKVNLLGFDFKEPCGKKKTDTAIKKRKLAWAKKIIDLVDESCSKDEN